MKRLVLWILLATIFASFASLGSCGSKEEETAKEEKKPEPPPDPGKMCETIWQQRQDLGGIIWKDEDGTKKPVFTEYCLKLPVEFLACDANNTHTDECIELLKEHQDDMNSVIVSGKLPGQADREEAERKAAAKAVVTRRQASRGDDSCSQICGHERDVSFEPDGEDTIKSEADCVKKCSELVALGGPSKELVDMVEKECLPLQNMFDFAKCKSDATIAMKAKVKDNPPRF